MKAIRQSITGLLLAAAVITAAGTTLPAVAADPSITIDRPAAGTIYVNDVPSGSAGAVGNAVNPAVSMGKSLTIQVTWNCPPPATTAHVELTVTDSSNAVVYDMGMLITGASGSTSRTWTTETSGTYKIATKVTCIQVRQTPQGPVSEVTGADTDTRDVIVVAK